MATLVVPAAQFPEECLSAGVLEALAFRDISASELLQLSQIAHKHIVASKDTLPQLALRYGSEVADIKRFNNLINEGLLQHRSSVYIPVLTERELVGCSVSFEYCPLLSRDIAVVKPKTTGAADVETLQHSLCMAREGTVAQDVMLAVDPSKLRELRMEVNNALLCLRPTPIADSKLCIIPAQPSMSLQAAGPEQSMSLPDLACATLMSKDSARYYLQEAEGNAVIAAASLVADVRWECTAHTAAFLQGLGPPPSYESVVGGQQDLVRLPWYGRLLLCGALCGRRRRKRPQRPMGNPHAQCSHVTTAEAPPLGNSAMSVKRASFDQGSSNANTSSSTSSLGKVHQCLGSSTGAGSDLEDDNEEGPLLLLQAKMAKTAEPYSDDSSCDLEEYIRCSNAACDSVGGRA